MKPVHLCVLYFIYTLPSCLSVFRGVSSNDFPFLENLCKKIIKEKQPFERLEVKKETLLEMFKVGTSFLKERNISSRHELTHNTLNLEVQPGEICLSCSSSTTSSSAGS